MPLKVTENIARRRSPALPSLVTLFGALVSAGCGDDAAGSPPVPPAEHLYALQTLVYQLDDDAPLSYVALTDTLDAGDVIELDDARELPGYAFISAIGGKLLVSSGEEPEIYQYEFGADRNWNELARLSFVGLGLPSYGAGLERHWFLNEHVAYLTHEVTSRVVWDPTDMLILDVKDDTNLEREADGLVLDATFNRPPLLLEGPVLKPFYYRDEDWFLFGPNTPIAVYDPETHAERAIIDVPCPALEVMSQDEDGNTYFSPWSYGPELSLFGEGPATCIRRVKRDSTLDEDWTPELSAWTGGRPVQVMRYVGGGKALATVLHVDEASVDFASGYDQELAAELDQHWRLWELDLDAETARPVEEIGASGRGFYLSVIDGRTFVFVPNETWTVTTIFEFTGDGHARERFKVPGIVSNWVKVR
jgi:hypothetical protein